MIKIPTHDLIQAIAAQGTPVRPLAAPGVRLIGWLLPSLIFSAMVVATVGLRTDLSLRLAEPRFVIEVTAALVTGILAAAAALCSGYPGRPKWERLAPVPPLIVWLSSLGEGCWQTVSASGPAGVHIMPDLICFPAILVVGSLPAVLLFSMVKRGAPLAPITTTSLVALASAAIGAAALRLFHAQDASVMVLLWQFGSVALLTIAAGAIGRRILRWPDAADFIARKVRA